MKNLLRITVVVLLLTNFIWICSQSFAMSTNVVLGLATIPLSLHFNKMDNNRHLLYLLLSILFLILFLLLGVKTLIYVASLSLIFYYLSNSFGKPTWALLFLLFLSTPMSDYLLKLFSFPIRLEITEFAVSILQLGYPLIHSSGNLIHLEEISFSVDEACMGINLISASLIFCVMLIVYWERKTQQQISFGYYLLVLSLGVVLCIIGNLLRIVTIVLCLALPGTLLHELIGLLSFLMYTLIPIVLISHVLFNRKSPKKNQIAVVNYNNLKTNWSIPIIGIAISISFFLKPSWASEGSNVDFGVLNTTDFKKEVLENGIGKLENEQALIYIKPAVNFYAAHHSPLVCWEGSGYKIHNISAMSIYNVPVQKGILVHEQDTLHTAWWFDSGNKQYNDQWQWRLDCLKRSEKFQLINVTSENMKDLTTSIRQLED